MFPPTRIIDQIGPWTVCTRSISKFSESDNQDNYIKYLFLSNNHSDTKITKIVILIKPNLKEFEVRAKAADLDTFDKIIEVSQEYFSDPYGVYFDSKYQSFKGNEHFQENHKTTLELVKAYRKYYTSLRGDYEKTFLSKSLSYKSDYKTTELWPELIKPLEILQKAEKTVEKVINVLDVRLPELKSMHLPELKSETVVCGPS